MPSSKKTKEELENEVANLKKQIEKLKPKHNERGAGRKPKATKEEIQQIIELREKGKSYRKIAEKVGLSVGTVFNIIKNNREVEDDRME